MKNLRYNKTVQIPLAVPMALVPFSKADEATFLDVSTVLWTVLVTVSKIINYTKNKKYENK